MDSIVSFDGAGMKLDSGEDADVICQAMAEKGQELIVLNLQGNSFGVEAAERVGISLSNHPKLKEAHFKDLFTTRGRDQVPQALTHLLKGIESSDARLIVLDLSDNAIGPIGAPSVINFLQSPSASTIEKLYVNNCGWGPEGSSSLSLVIPLLKNLREFVCGRSRLENLGATNMSKSLTNIIGLEVLKLNQNGIGVRGIVELAKVLEANHESLRELDLSDNTIKPEGCKLLHNFISKAKNLKVLSLSDALLQNKGFGIICDALSRSPALGTLESVHFEGNELRGNKIIDLIETTFATCKDDFSLNLLDNEFTREQKKRLRSLAHENYLVDSDDDSYYDEEDEEVDESEEDEVEEESDGDEVEEDSEGDQVEEESEEHKKVQVEENKQNRDEEKAKAREEVQEIEKEKDVGDGELAGLIAQLKTFSFQPQ